MNYRETQS